jgi:hypothetical protein
MLSRSKSPEIVQLLWVIVFVENSSFDIRLLYVLVLYYLSLLKRLYHKEDNHLLIFFVSSSDRRSNISQKYKLGNF